MLAEPDVALTDLVLAIECAWASWWCWRRSGTTRGWFAMFFASLGSAALLGGTMHGFFGDGGAIAATLWFATLASIGVTGLSMWGLAGALAAPPRRARRLVLLGAALAAAYALALACGIRVFAIALAAYLPPALALLGAYIALVRRGRHRAAWGIAGVLLTFAAAGIQSARVGLHPRYCNHNALYHLVQAIALGCVWISASAVLARSPSASPPGNPPCPR